MLFGCLDEEVPRSHLEALEAGTTDPLLRRLAERLLSNPVMREHMAQTPQSAGNSDPKFEAMQKSIEEMKESAKRWKTCFDK